MFSFFKRQRPWKDLASLSREELLKVQKDLPKWINAKFDEKPVENRLKFVESFRAELEERKDTMDPAIRKEYLGAIQEIEQEAHAHILAATVDHLLASVDEWEKQKDPPIREIIRWENELTELLGAMDAIPDYMRAGATKDVKLLLQRLQKLQE